MSWRQRALDRLTAEPVCGYQPASPASSEPTAWAALALAAHHRRDEAATACQWLCDLQAEDGSVGVCAGEPGPRWPTSLVVLVWSCRADGERLLPEDEARLRIDRARNWILSTYGKPLPKNDDLGHDTTLAAWPWAEGTHGWIEPTALSVLALRAAGCSDHPRTREGVRMLVDRQMPDGGCNYGNTLVFDQPLRPHVEPTGLALLALAGEDVRDVRIEKSLQYLSRSLSARTPTASLAWGLLALAAYDRRPKEADEWLEAAAERTLSRDRGPLKLALALAAAAPEEVAWIWSTPG